MVQYRALSSQVSAERGLTLVTASHWHTTTLTHLLARGGAYYEVAKQQDATGDTARARISYEASLGDMKDLLESDPAPQIKDSAFRTLGAGMIRLGRQDEAASYYQELIAASDDPQEQATFSMLLTELYYDQQDFRSAAQTYEELVMICPNIEEYVHSQTTKRKQILGTSSIMHKHCTRRDYMLMQFEQLFELMVLNSHSR